MADGKRPEFLQASGFMFAMTLGMNLCNYGFHAAASRWLGPAEYGTLVTMVALLMVMVMPSQAVQMVVAQRVAVEEIRERRDFIAVYFWESLKQVLILACFLSLGLAASHLFWKKFFHLHSSVPIWSVALATLISLCLPVARGLLQGLQMFFGLGLNQFLDSLLRMALGAGLILLGWGTTGGILSSAFAGGLCLMLAVSLVPWLFKKGRPAAGRIRLFERYFWLVSISLSAYSALTSLDLMVVKHFFPAEEAGYYSAASIVGKAFIILPLAISQVLFARVSEEHARENATRHLLQQAVGLAAVLLGAGVGAVRLLAPWIIITLFGKAYLSPLTLRLVNNFAMAFAPVALTQILLQYQLAVNQGRLAVILLADIAVLAFALAVWHASLNQILWVAGLNHALVFCIGYVMTVRRSSEWKTLASR